MNNLKRRSIIWISVIGIGILLVLDFANIGRYIPFVTQLNYQFWNLIIVIALFCITYCFIDSRNINRKVAQEKNGRFLISLACKECVSMSMMLDDDKIKNIVLSDFDGNKPFMEQKRYAGMYNLPFSNDSDIKKLAFDGVIDHTDFCKYIEIKNYYQQMIAMYFIVPDYPEQYKKLRIQMNEAINELEKTTK